MGWLVVIGAAAFFALHELARAVLGRDAPALLPVLIANAQIAAVIPPIQYSVFFGKPICCCGAASSAVSASVSGAASSVWAFFATAGAD